MRHIDYYNQFVIAKGGDSSGITPTGTLEIKIQENGTTTHDVTHYAQAEVTVDVPQPDGTIQITQNGQHDVAQYATADVNVPNPSTGTLELDYGELEFGQTVDETQDVTDKAEVHIAVSAKEPSGTLDITENGTKDVAGYAAVNVQVPQPTGTKEINITQNGESTEDVAQYENAHIVVNVPNEDTGTKEIRITENGNSQHDVTGFATADITVAVPEPTGTAELEYTLEAGNYSLDETADVSGKAEAHVTVDASALEPTGTKEVTVNQNGDITEDVKDYASVKITTQVEGGDPELEEKYNELLKVLKREKADSFTVTNPDIRKLGDYAFYNNQRITSALLPNVGYIGDSCFANCYMLSEISLGELTIISSRAFQNCRRLENFENGYAKNIESYAFYDTSSVGIASDKMILKSVKCASARSIERCAFEGLTKIETIDILGGGDIERMADRNKALESLVNFIMRNDETVTHVDAYTAFAETTNIYVPDALVDSYKTATNWSKYAEQIHPLSEYVEPEV